MSYLPLVDEFPNGAEVAIESAVVVWREGDTLFFRNVDEVSDLR